MERFVILLDLNLNDLDCLSKSDNLLVGLREASTKLEDTFLKLRDQVSEFGTT
jgi:hypothetical protein